MPDWNAERAKLKERFAAGDIGTSTREELEQYLLVLACSTPAARQEKQHDLENEAFAPVIKKSLETRIMERQLQIAEEHHAKTHHLNVKAYQLSYSAFWVSVSSAIAAISAAVSAGIQAHYAAPNLPPAIPPAVATAPNPLLSPPTPPVTNSVPAPPAPVSAARIQN